MKARKEQTNGKVMQIDSASFGQITNSKDKLASDEAPSSVKTSNFLKNQGEVTNNKDQKKDAEVNDVVMNDAPKIAGDDSSQTQYEDDIEEGSPVDKGAHSIDNNTDEQP